MKIRKILSLVINLLAVIASFIGILVVQSTLDSISFIKYFTLVTNLLIIVSGLISVGYSVDALIKKNKDVTIPNFVYVLKLITGVNALITFITVVSYLQYTAYAGIAFNSMTNINNILHHYVAPLLFVLGFIFFDLDKKYPFKLSFFGVIVLVIYMAYAIPFSNISACSSWWGEAPYDFMNYSNVTYWIFLLVPGFLIAGVGLSIVLWLLNRIVYLIFIGEEVESQEISEEEKKLDDKILVTTEDEQEVAEEIKKSNAGPRIYHISKRDDKMWQVKFAKGKKAIKLFNTQAEAIVFAKKLARSQSGSIRVHSVKGKIRKAK